LLSIGKQLVGFAVFRLLLRVEAPSKQNPKAQTDLFNRSMTRRDAHDSRHRSATRLRPQTAVFSLNQANQALRAVKDEPKRDPS